MTVRRVSVALLVTSVAVISVPSQPALSGPHLLPAILVSPEEGPPTTITRVRGRGFGAAEIVDVSFDATPVGSIQTGQTGRFVVSISVPVDGLPGAHLITAVGETSGLVATTPYTVRTNWTQDRFDASGSAYNPYENVLSQANASQLETKWWVETGQNFAAPEPVVVDGVVYAATYYGTVQGFDIADGAVVWKVETGGLMSGAAPAVQDGVLYTGTLDGDVIAYDIATASEVWRTRLGAGIWESPRVAEGRLFVVPFELGVEALDAGSGDVLWSDPDIQVREPPALAYGLLYTVGAYGPVSALDPNTGRVVWSEPLPSQTWSGSPAVVGDGAVAVGNLTDYSLTVWEAGSGEFRWSKYLGGSVRSPVIVGSTVFVLITSPQYRVRAFDLDTGDVLFSAKVGIDGYAPIVANGVLYVGSYGGQMSAVELQTGHVVWTGPQMGSYAWGDPVVADGVLYGASNNGRVYAFALPG